MATDWINSKDGFRYARILTAGEFRKKMVESDHMDVVAISANEHEPLHYLNRELVDRSSRHPIPIGKLEGEPEGVPGRRIEDNEPVIELQFETIVPAENSEEAKRIFENNALLVRLATDNQFMKYVLLSIGSTVAGMRVESLLLPASEKTVQLLVSKEVITNAEAERLRAELSKSIQPGGL